MRLNNRRLLELAALVVLIVLFRLITVEASGVDATEPMLYALLSSGIGVLIALIGFRLRGERVGLIMALLWLAGNRAIVVQSSPFLIAFVILLSYTLLLYAVDRLSRPSAPSLWAAWGLTTIAAFIIFFLIDHSTGNADPSHGAGSLDSALAGNGLILFLLITTSLTLFKGWWSAWVKGGIARITARARNTIYFPFLLLIVALGAGALVTGRRAEFALIMLIVLLIASAILLDQTAIWFARRTKEKPGNQDRLTRPLITRFAILLTAATTILQLLASDLLRPN